MSNSTSLNLARALLSSREGKASCVELAGELLPSQVGCVYRIRQEAAVKLDSIATRSMDSFAGTIESAFGPSGFAVGLVGHWPSPQEFTQVAGDWFEESSGRDGEARAGYWLADAFLRGVGLGEALALTRFLSSPAIVAPAETLDVRRYPTGGISEKQALILPPLIRALSARCGWCSSFLVARRLAHTGGTRDKLAAVPGFRMSPVSQILDWDKRVAPVRYFSAGSDFCPRDARMYRLRSEMGAVADHGLMASSIMAKQISAPADIILLDILYGQSAFLRGKEEAERFSMLCTQIASYFGIAIELISRQAKPILGRSIGVSVELLEALEILQGSRNYSSAKAELDVAKGFIAKIVALTGRELETNAVVDELVTSGQALESMLALWADHGAEQRFIKEVRQDPRATILREFSSMLIHAPATGRVHWKAVELADWVNNSINQYHGGQAGSVAAGGGIELLEDDGEIVEEAAPIARLHTQCAYTGSYDTSNLFDIAPC